MIKRFAMNTRGRDLVIGDIHGHFTKAEVSLKDVGFDPRFDRVFALGDLVDRGPESEASLEWLAKPWFHSLRGNHEQMCIDGDAAMHLMNGGGWFRSMPELARRDYVLAFSELPLVIEIQTPVGRVGLVHADEGGAGWGRLVSLLENPDAHPGVVANCLWGRSRITHMDDSIVPDVRAVIMGHTPVERITSLGNAIYLDTGAWKPEAGNKPFAILDIATLAQAYHPRRDFWGETR